MSTIEIVMSAIVGLESILVTILLAIKFKEVGKIRKIAREEAEKAIHDYNIALNHLFATASSEVFSIDDAESVLSDSIQVLRADATSHSPQATETDLRNLKSYLLRREADGLTLSKDMKNEYIGILCKMSHPLASEVLDLIRNIPCNP